MDVSACINVLYGTLLKIYPHGAKVPTFTSRVVLMKRLMGISAMCTSDQVEFLRQNQSLTRLCFMEYSLNALLDWLPCEKELIFSMYPVMHTYSNVAIAMCDVFRQEGICTGQEDWALLNKVCVCVLSLSLSMSLFCEKTMFALLLAHVLWSRWLQSA